MKRLGTAKNMTFDAAIYIMLWSNIEAGRINLSKVIAADAARGLPWPKSQIEDAIKKMAAIACKSWKIKLPKLAFVVNEANGKNFLPICQ